MKNTIKHLFLILICFYLASVYLRQSFQTSTGIFALELPPIPDVRAKLPPQAEQLNPEPRNIFNFRKKQIKPETPVTPPKPKSDPRPEPPKKTEPVAPRGDFTGLTLIGVRVEQGKFTAIWEYNSRLYITAAGDKFAHFSVLTIEEKIAEIEDTEPRVRRKYSLDSE
ncbi:MAG: hypothetical protein PHQ23_05625 [Candidatus Wallbacteria bacterium]|nr:hypothetical protein [Candidatus Wallbacteria bacterium]